VQPTTVPAPLPSNSWAHLYRCSGITGDLANRAARTTRRLPRLQKFTARPGMISPASLRHASVSEVLKGIRRTKGTAPSCKAPLLVGQLKAALRDGREDLLGVRDRALLLIGFAGAFRRSELVGLDLADVAFTYDGLVVTLRRSKTDQERNAGRVVSRMGRSRLPAQCARCEPCLVASKAAGTHEACEPVGTRRPRDIQTALVKGFI